VHAAEYASIAAALEIGQTLDPGTLHGRAIVVPVMNIPSFVARSIYICPLDGKNLNRVFPGNAQGTASEQIAEWVFQNVIAQGDAYVDLHGGDLVEALVPFTIFFRSGNERVDQASLDLAKVFGIRYLVCSEVQGSTFAAASRAGVPAILAESGGQGIWNPPDVALLTDGVGRVLRHLKMLPGGAPEAKATTLLERFLWLRSEHDAFWYPGVPVNAEVKRGQQLGVIKNAEGDVLQTAVSPADGRVLFIVSSLAINNTDPLLAVGA
jgi:predicted deacylase